LGYLICGKCKSYYKLQPGESAEDFIDQCNCGGKLRYAENIDIVNPDWREAPINDICPKCGDKNPKGAIFCNNCGSQIKDNENSREHQKTNQQYRNNQKIYKTNNEIDAGLINGFKREFNFNNIRWSLVLPVAMALTILEAIPIDILFPLIFIGLAVVGYLFKDRYIGTKNAIVTGAISFFFGSLITGAFVFTIPMVFLGIIIGAICGWTGAYIKTKT